MVMMIMIKDASVFLLFPLRVFFRNKLVIKVEKGDVANVKKREYNFFVCEGILGRGKDTAFWVGKRE